MKQFVTTLLSLCLLQTAAFQSFGADAVRDKTIDAFKTLDPKVTRANGLVAKVISTPDPIHHKALELTIDFAAPGAMPNFGRDFPAGLIDPNKYSGIRFFTRSDVGTKYSVWLCAIGKNGGLTHADGSSLSVASGVSTSDTWTEVFIPFEKFGNIGGKEWKNGEQKIYQSGLPIQPDDYPKFNKVMFAFSINQRGTSTVGQVLIRDLSLVAK